MKKHLPSGWQEKTIGEIFQFIKNYTNSRAELNDYDEISYIHYGDIHKYYRHRIECDKVDFPKISAEKLSKDINKISYAKNGDLIVVDASEDYEGTCISAEIKNLNYKLVSGMHTFLLRDENKIFADGYRGYIFYNHDVHIQCCKIATGISVYGISQENLKNIKIMIPPLDEQKRIADILSTFDDLIENLNKLIEKKKIYKKGVMQRVLSGKVRFEGFTDEWETYKFEDIFIRIAGKKYQINQNEYKEIGKYPVIDQGKKYITAYSDNADKVFNNDNIIVFGDHTRIFKYVDFNFIIGADGVQLLKTNKEFDTKFMYYNLSNQYIPNTGYNRHFKFILDMSFYIPPSIEEQNKTAELLTLIDKDIEILKQLLHLRKLQKKGLMQKLLTGEVRI